MKEALRKDGLREVKKSISRFLSILFMVALGVFVFVGLTVTAPIMDKSAEVKFVQSNMFDLLVKSSMGLEKKDIDIINSQKGIEDIEYTYESYLQVRGGEELIRISSLPSRISMPIIKEGRLPSAQGELALDYDLKSTGYKLGDNITFGKEKDKYNLKDDKEDFKRYEYTIVGFVETPEVFENAYKGVSDKNGGTVNGFAYILKEDFNLDKYTAAKIKFENTKDLKTYEKLYKENLQEHNEAFKLAFNSRSKERLAVLRGDIEEEIIEGREKIADAKDKIKEGEDKISDGEKKLKDGETDYYSGKKEFDKEISSAEKDLNKGKRELADGKRELDESRDKLTDAEIKLADGKKELSEKEQEFEDGKRKYNEGLGEYKSGVKTLEEERKRLLDGEKELNKSRIKLDDAKREIEDGEREYLKGKNELESKRPELEEGKRKYEEGLAEFNEGLGKFNLGKEQYEDGLRKYNQGLLEYNEGYTQFQGAKLQIEEGEAQIAAAEAEIQGLKAQLSAGLTQAGISSPEEIPGKISELNLQKSQLAGNIQALKQQIQLLEQDIDPETGEITPESQAQIAILNEQISQIEGAIVQIDAVIQGLNQLNTLAQGIAAGEAELNQKKVELEQGKAKLLESEKELENAKKILDESKVQLDSAKNELDANEKKIEQGRIELEKGKRELEEGQAQFKEGEEKLNKAAQELAEGKAKYEMGEEEFRKGNEEFQDGKRQFEEGEKKLADAGIELADAKAKLDDGEIKLRDGKKELEDSIEEYNSGKIEFARGQADYNSGVKNFIEGTKKLKEEREKGQKKLNEAYEDILSGKRELEDSKREFFDKKTEAMEDIEEGESEISDAVKILEIIKQPKYTITPRTDDDSVNQYLGYANSVRLLSYIFPMFFYIIAMLVSLTTMTRMVDEQRVSVGTLKALGYSDKDISKKFLYYGSSAAIIGGVIGGLLGNYFLSYVIGHAYSIGSIVDELKIEFYPLQNFIAIGIGLLCTGFVAYYVLRKSLKENSAELMRPKAPKTGNRIALERVKLIWNRFSFLQKVTARNIFRYKNRMIMTLLGVMGCTALLVLGFGIDTSVSGVVEKQFNQLTKYDMVILYEKALSTESYRNYRELLKNEKGIENYANVRFERVTTDGKNDKEQTLTLMVPKDDNFYKIMTLRNRKTGNNIDMPLDGVLLTEKMTELKNISIGDNFYIKNEEDEIVSVKLAGIVEGYAGSYIYMSPSYYSNIFKKDFATNGDLINLNDYGEEHKSEIINRFSEEKSVLSAASFEYLRNIMVQLMGSIAQVVVIILLASTMLALIVLYNLTNINIAERLRELSTIKVLGFYNKEVTDYIYRETWSLTIIGILIGFVVGKILHYNVLKVVVPDHAMLDPQLVLRDYLVPGIVTILVSLLVKFVVKRKMKNIDMIEALKANE